MSIPDNLTLAKRQVAAIKGFYIHLAVFVGVMALLLVINAATGSVWWVQWPFIGWGIGILGHAMAVFGRAPQAVAQWEQSKTDELKRRLDEAEARTQGAPAPAASAAPGNGDAGRTPR